MKNIKWSNIIIAICYIAAGIMFFADPNLTKEMICSWIGYGLIIAGGLYVLTYFLHPVQESFMKTDLRDGLMLLTIGTVAIIKKEIFIGIVYFAIAIVIMVSGFKKLQDCVDAWRLGLKYGVTYFVLASVSIVVGLFILIDSTLSIKTLHNLIGVGLLYSGASDLVSTIFLASKMTSYMNSIKKADPKKIEKEEILDDKNETPEI